MKVEWMGYPTGRTEGKRIKLQTHGLMNKQDAERYAKVVEERGGEKVRIVE